MTYHKKTRKIASHYGFWHQAWKLVEECGELAAAMAKYVLGQAGRSVVIEEMADVTIMLRQMEYLMDIQKCELHAAMDFKVDRQLDRMKDENPLDKAKKCSIIKNHQEIAWYQELYDKARKAQVASAEEAAALRRENEQLRAALQDRRHKRRGA